MRMKPLLLHLFLLITSSALISGCVNTIENTDVPVTNQIDKSPLLFPYSGIVRADPIAHDKAEIIFEKVKEDDTNYTYRLVTNDAEPGVEINTTSLISYGANRYYFIQSGLNIRTKYKFKIRAVSKSDGSQSSLERVQTLQTFDNRVADFNGIINISPVAGSEGASQPSLRVQWDKVPYFNWGNQTPLDPVRYEVYYSSVGPEDLWTSSPTRRGPVNITVLDEFVHPSETVVTDFLVPDTTYYFWVRAVHRAYSIFEVGSGGYFPVDRENNTKYMAYRTAPLGGLPGFIGDAKGSFNLYPGLKADGFDKVRTSWQPAQGTYLKYKLIYLNQAPAAGAEFSDPQLTTIAASVDPQIARIIEINKESAAFKNSNLVVSALRADQTYYFKLYLCTDLTCSLTGTSAAESYDVKSIKVVPDLANFLGINSIDNPSDPTKLDEITLNFDSPVLSVGWATRMEFYCDDGATSYLLSETANTTAPPGSPCLGLRNLTFSNDSTFIQSLKKLTIKGIIVDKDNPKEYCFSATPVLEYTGLSGQVQVRRDNRVQRCIVPEIITPIIQQFAGLNTCTPVTTINDKKLRVNYSTPTAGIFQKYVVFWKKKTGTNFSINSAISAYQAKMVVDGLDKVSCTDTEYCFQTVNTSGDIFTPALASGTYNTAAMTFAKVTVATVDKFYWSQINNSIKECKIPPPLATFKGWARVFAIGPKISHMEKGVENFKVREAINDDGIPYELSLLTNLGSAPILFKPPGQANVIGSTPNQTVNLFNANDLDIANDPNSSYGSIEGIVSLAWEDVLLDNTGDQTIWSNEQTLISRSDENRKYGFKVFRSDNNKISWQELTTNVIHSVTIGGKKYFHFTDYSVTQPTQDSMGNQKARIYWYKVVPRFDGEDLVFYETNLKYHSDLAQVRVTLPPPNMALVHRWMANRSQCNEIRRTPAIDKNYSCDFTGLGSVPNKPPFNKDDTKLDLRGDLLIDRYELGCKFTRGPEGDQSAISSADFSTSALVTPLANANPGCFKVGASNAISGVPNPLPGLDLSNSATLPSSSDLTPYLMAGDCIGESYDSSIPVGYCSTQTASLQGRYLLRTGFIGFAADPTSTNFHLQTDCNTRYYQKRFGLKDASDTSFFLTKDGQLGDANTSPFEWAKNNLAQSQFGAVYHNTHTDASYVAQPIIGINSSNNLIALDGWRYAGTCSINLAAIDPADNQLVPRWVNINKLDGSINSLTTASTVAEFRANTQLYKSGHLNLPSTTIAGATKIGRVMTTNGADAPPISGINRNIAEQLCNNFDVDLVIGGNNQVDVTLSTHTKRLLRRREFVAANMWPENYDVNRNYTNYLEGVGTNPADIVAKWPTAQYSGLNSCSNGPGNNAILTRWSTLPARPKAYNPFFTGSDSTKLCISRYGVQDMIGNIEELSSEILNCAYTTVKMNFGKIRSDNIAEWDSDGARGVPLEDDSPSAPQVNIDLLSPDSTLDSGRYFLLRQRTVPSSSSESEFFTIKNSSGGTLATYTDNTPSSSEPSDYGPYVGEVGDDAGYCAIADSTPTRRSDEFNLFYNVDFFSNSFSRVLNPQLFTQTNTYDPLSAVNFRDGQGFMLDFGPKHLASRLLYKDAIGFSWDWEVYNGTPSPPSVSGSATWNNENQENYFFSHVLGLPLTCGGLSLSSDGNDWWQACSNQVSDTYVVPRETYGHTLIPPEIKIQTVNRLAGDVINDYEIGGSKITNDGLREVTLTPRTFNIPVGGMTAESAISLITGVQLQATYNQQYPLLPSGQLTNVIPQTIIKVDRALATSDNLRLQETSKVTSLASSTSDSTQFEPGSTVHYWDVRWSMPRDVKMNFYQGGHFDNAADVDRHNGRFSLHVGLKNNVKSSGVRCGVLINEGN
jgi:hypothetical protein